MTKEELMKIFSRNLERLLVDRKKSQADMARYMCVSSATASEWVNGKKMPRTDKIQSLANWLNVELSDLLTDKNETMMTVKLTNSEEQLLQRFRALTQQRQHDVERIINMYYEEVSP